MIFDNILANMKACLAQLVLAGTALCSTVIVPAWAMPDDPIAQIMRERGQQAAPAPSLALPQRPVSSSLVVHAMAYVGLPYRWGGGSFEDGFDCSAFVQAAFTRSMGIRLPRTTAEQALATSPIQRHELKAGDLVFFNTLGPRYSHVGIYIGDGRFVHSPRSGAFIRIENFGVNYWQKRFTGARRVLTEERLSQMRPSV
jgi:cell wall-associated NlpC family hydrolase